MSGSYGNCVFIFKQFAAHSEKSVVPLFFIDCANSLPLLSLSPLLGVCIPNYLLVCDLPFQSDNGLHFSKSQFINFFFMASVLFKKDLCALDVASSFLSLPRLSFSPSHASPGLCVFSHVMWSWNFYHAAHSSVDIHFGHVPVYVQSHVGNSLGPGVFPREESKACLQIRHPCGADEEKFRICLSQETRSCANVLPPLFPHGAVIRIFI